MSKPVAAPDAIRPAASIVLVRDGAEGLETFMLERHAAGPIVFAGALVFPGGKVDAGDADAVWDTLAHPSAPVPERAFWVAAVRETFEEAGLLLARSVGGADPLPAARANALVDAARADETLQSSAGFARLMHREGLALDTGAMLHFGHWITPDWQPKRFDTHFFLAAAPADQVSALDHHESAEGLWITPRQALAETAAGKRKLVAVTRFTLELLASWGSVAEAMTAARARPIVTIQPWREKTPDGLVLYIPPGSGYLTTSLRVE